MVYLARMQTTMSMPGTLLFNKQKRMELINVCGGLECSTLRLNLKLEQHLGIWSVQRTILYTIKLYTNTHHFVRNKKKNLLTAILKG